jgi:nucleoside phosphorylase
MTLVLAAWAPELDGLRARPGVSAQAIGIGLVEASAGAERAISESRPSRVILVGTCGGGFPIGTIVVAESARLVLREGEESPAPMPVRVRADANLARAAAEAAGGLLVCVATTLGVSTAGDSHLGPLEVEHLEAFAVLRACERAGLPATAILAVANRVGPGARTEWRAHRSEAEAAAAQALGRVLDAI